MARKGLRSKSQVSDILINNLLFKNSLKILKISIISPGFFFLVTSFSYGIHPKILFSLIYVLIFIPFNKQLQIDMYIPIRDSTNQESSNMQR